MTRLTFLIIFALVTGSFAQDKQAPDFSLPDMEGNNFQLSEHYGKGPLLINFWATWCVPCRTEMRKFKKIYEHFKDEGLQILSVSIDDPKTVSKVPGFIKSNRFPFTVLLDTNNEIFQLYKGTNPPLTILLDKTGKVIYEHTGYRKGDEKKVEEMITELIGGDKEAEQK